MTPEALTDTALSMDEQSELADCEARVERGLETALDCVEALRTIHKKRLFRQTHATFELYFEERWGRKKSQMYRLLAAADVRENVPQIETERQARELVGLAPEIQQAAYTIAELVAPKDAEDKPIITASLLKNCVEGVQEEVRDVLQGHMTDEHGDPRPLSQLTPLMQSNVVERLREKTLRQAEKIRTSMDQRAARAHAAGQQKDVPAQPASIFLMYLIRELTRAIEYVKEEKGSLHPRYFAPYHLAKSAIGEALEGSEVSLLPDKVSIEGECERCGHGETVRDTVLTAQHEGHVKSLRIKLCDFCVSIYEKVIDLTPNGEVVAR
jgi:hypothetical protein